MTLISKRTDVTLAAIRLLALVKQQGGADTFAPRSRALVEQVVEVFHEAGVLWETAVDRMLAGQGIELPALTDAQVARLTEVIRASGIPTSV